MSTASQTTTGCNGIYLQGSMSRLPSAPDLLPRDHLRRCPQNMLGLTASTMPPYPSWRQHNREAFICRWEYLGISTKHIARTTNPLQVHRHLVRWLLIWRLDQGPKSDVTLPAAGSDNPDFLRAADGWLMPLEASERVSIGKKALQ